MKLTLHPVDTFTFRDHRDFDAGINTVGFSFPFPSPSTVYGALRSAFIYFHSDFQKFAAGLDDEVKMWMGTPEEYGKFKVLGTFIEDKGNVFVPVPLDMQIVQEENAKGEVKEYAIPLLLVKEIPKASDGKSYRLFARSEQKTVASEGAFISLLDFQKLICEELEKVPVYRISHWIVTEEKIGIAYDRETHRIKNEMLYQLPMYRFKNYKETYFSTYVKDSPSFNNVKFARIGRKGRPWVIKSKAETLSILTEKYKEKVEKEIKQSGIAKIIFLTPTFLDNGTHSLIVEEKKLHINDDLNLDVLTIATRRPDVIGGFDIVKKRPKDRQNAIPAGTVIYVKVPDKKVTMFVETMKLYTLTNNRKNEGFGLCTIGAAKLIVEEDF